MDRLALWLFHTWKSRSKANSKAFLASCSWRPLSLICSLLLHWQLTVTALSAFSTREGALWKKRPCLTDHWFLEGSYNLGSAQSLFLECRLLDLEPEAAGVDLPDFYFGGNLWITLNISFPLCEMGGGWGDYNWPSLLPQAAVKVGWARAAGCRVDEWLLC